MRTRRPDYASFSRYSDLPKDVWGLVAQHIEYPGDRVPLRQISRRASRGIAAPYGGQKFIRVKEIESNRLYGYATWRRKQGNYGRLFMGITDRSPLPVDIINVVREVIPLEARSNTLSQLLVDWENEDTWWGTELQHVLYLASFVNVQRVYGGFDAGTLFEAPTITYAADEVIARRLFTDVRFYSLEELKVAEQRTRGANERAANRPVIEPLEEEEEEEEAEDESVDILSI